MQMDRRFLDVRLTVDGVVTAPAKTTVGTQYLVASSNATGDFAGKEGNVAYRTADGWKFFKPAVGQMEVFSLNDFRIHRYETTGWTAYDISSGKVKGAVISLATSADITGGDSLPVPTSVGQKLVDTGSLKVYTSTDTESASDWDSGVAASVGDRYASVTDHKIYYVEDNTTAFSVETPVDGDIFVVKNTDDLYTFDGDNNRFQNLTNIADNPVYKKHTEVNTLTVSATDITNGYIDLTRKAELDCGVTVAVNGVVQTAGVDFVAETRLGAEVSSIRWNNEASSTAYGLNDLIVAGDIMVVSFSTIHDINQTYDN